MYKQGIQELEQALNINIDPNGENNSIIIFCFWFISITCLDTRAVDLHAKTRRNLAMARERVDVLGRIEHIPIRLFFLFFIPRKIDNKTQKTFDITTCTLCK